MSDKPTLLLNKAVQPLDKSHDRKGFDCGVLALNTFLQQQAMQMQQLDKSKTYVLLADDNATIVGYFTLAATQFQYHETVNEKYQKVNTTGLIARLAVDVRFKKQKVGSYLLRQALEKLMQANEIIGIPIVVIDAKDGAAAFYQQFGFQYLDDEQRRMFITMSAIQKASNIVD